MRAGAVAGERIELVNIIGPKTAHSYHPDAKNEINRRIDRILDGGGNPVADKVRFRKWTLRYNQMDWVTVDALAQHWERARVEAELDEDDNTVKVATRNVSALTLSMAPGLCPLDNARPVKVAIDGARLPAPRPLSDRSWEAHFEKAAGKWGMAPRGTNGTEAPRSPLAPTLRNQHRLQVPIDHPFMDS